MRKVPDKTLPYGNRDAAGVLALFDETLTRAM